MGYAKVWQRKKFGHMKVQEEKEKNRDTWRSQGIEKNGWAHEGS